MLVTEDLEEAFTIRSGGALQDISPGVCVADAGPSRGQDEQGINCTVKLHIEKFIKSKFKAV